MWTKKDIETLKKPCRQSKLKMFSIIVFGKYKCIHAVTCLKTAKALMRQFF